MPGYFVADKPMITMGSKYMVTNFETTIPVSKAMVYFCFYVPDQDIEVPLYRRDAIKDLDDESTNHEEVSK
jgi:hypothetical protein